MNATTIVRALLDSDEDLLAELGHVASNPITAPIKFALERGEEYVKRVAEAPGPAYTAMDIHIKPIGTTEWARKKGSRMVHIRWLHKAQWGADKQGGGYFFVKPEQFSPFLRELAELIETAREPHSSDEFILRAYDRVIRYRYSAPRKPHARQKHTETGLYAYRR